jgi:hypothetical protein
MSRTGAIKRISCEAWCGDSLASGTDGKGTFKNVGTLMYKSVLIEINTK